MTTTAQTARIQFVPQGKNPVNESFKLSIAIELLRKRVNFMEVQFYADREAITVDDWIETYKAAKFINEYGGNKKVRIEYLVDYLKAELGFDFQKYDNYEGLL